MLVARTLLLFAAASAASFTCQASKNPAADSTCASFLTTQQVSDGLSARWEPSCLDNPNGAGCFQSSQCQYCQAKPTRQSTSLPLCSTSSSGYEAASSCTISLGDQQAGLGLFYDPTCSIGGLGCYGTTCRFCKAQAWNTSPYSACPSGATTTGSPGTTNSTTVESNDCLNAVTASGLAAVSYVSEPTCNTATPRLVGCVANSQCQLCRTGKNERNQYLTSCKVLQYLKSTESAAAAAPLSSLSTSTTEELHADTIGFSATTKADAPETSTDSTTEATWLVFPGVGVVAAVLAVAAVRKVRRDRERANELPCTPLDGSLVSLNTCVSNL